MLIQAGSDVNHGREAGFTALFSAVFGGDVEVVRILLDAGAEVVPVQGNELRGYAGMGNSNRREVILRMLDAHKSN